MKDFRLAFTEITDPVRYMMIYFEVFSCTSILFEH